MRTVSEFLESFGIGDYDRIVVHNADCSHRTAFFRTDCPVFLEVGNGETRNRMESLAYSDRSLESKVIHMIRAGAKVLPSLAPELSTRQGDLHVIVSLGDVPRRTIESAVSTFESSRTDFVVIEDGTFRLENCEYEPLLATDGYGGQPMAFIRRY